MNAKLVGGLEKILSVKIPLPLKPSFKEYVSNGMLVGGFLGFMTVLPTLVNASDYRDRLQRDLVYCQDLHTSEEQRNVVVAPETHLACQYVQQQYASTATPPSYFAYVTGLPSLFTP